MELKAKRLGKTQPQVINRVAVWAFMVGFVVMLGGAEGRIVKSFSTFEYSAMSCRAHSASVTEFGAVGDGKTLNTRAFAAAIAHLSRYSAVGGGLLYVPAGRWLTGTFNLTSHFTLYLHKQAVLLASQDVRDWPLSDPLPSYGHGREAPGGRYMSFIFGTNLTDVIITGDNGKIDGQGGVWWTKFHKGSLKYTRPHLIEIMHSRSIQISNLTLLNSPFWTVHPVYKTAIGRGAYVKDIYVKRMTMHTMKWVSKWMAITNRIPTLITIRKRPGDTFTGICIANVTLGMTPKHKKYPWTCTDVQGMTSGVTPSPCDSLPDQGPEKISACDFPADSLPIDEVKLKQCSYRINYF
ncbi:hypothetical protein NL676_010660 [Syzygium grande]|nr:hypothetical protein NL676_010660 [Syzygium grande]